MVLVKSARCYQFSKRVQENRKLNIGSVNIEKFRLGTLWILPLKKFNYMTFFVYNSFYNERYIITFIIINDERLSLVMYLNLYFV